MYRTEHVEARPMSCSDCGHAWAGERHCAKCGRFVLFARRRNPGDDPHTYTDVVSMEESMQFPEYAELCANPNRESNRTTTVSNRWDTIDSEPVRLVRPDGTCAIVPKLYRIWRRPVGMLGCWVQFRWNGKIHSPDLSVPIGVSELPRDAESLTDDEAARYWFKSSRLIGSSSH